MTKDQYIKYAMLIARISQRGRGLFCEAKTAVNELDPNSHQSWTKLRRFFSQNQVISKKKGLHQNWNGFSSQILVISKKKKGLNQNSVTSDQLWVRSRKKNSTFLVQIGPKGSPSQRLLPISVGGLFSFLEQKSTLKALKTCYFAYFSGQWGGE